MSWSCTANHEPRPRATPWPLNGKTSCCAASPTSLEAVGRAVDRINVTAQVELTCGAKGLALNRSRLGKVDTAFLASWLRPSAKLAQNVLAEVIKLDQTNNQKGARLLKSNVRNAWGASRFAEPKLPTSTAMDLRATNSIAAIAELRSRVSSIPSMEPCCCQLNSPRKPVLCAVRHISTAAKPLGSRWVSGYGE